MDARLVIEYEREVDGRWIAEVDALPGCMVYADSRDEARRKVVGLALEIIRDLVEQGEWETELPVISFADAA